MPSYKTPGVYVEEISSGAKPIEAVGTSTAGFVGISPKTEAFINEVKAVKNWTQFLQLFCSDDSAPTELSSAVFGFFSNGGSRCYIVNVGEGGSLMSKGTQRGGVDLFETVDEIAIVAAPGFTSAVDYEALLTHCEKMGDRVAVLDAPLDTPEIDALTKVSSPSEGSGLRARQSDRGFGAYYFPWLKINDPISGEIVDCPPSGHMAGLYARTDATRGVHKAPANDSLRGALDVTYAVTDSEQAILNPVGVNCIRLFQTEGIRVWGARTLAAEASAWRYLNVRRLFNMIEESIVKSTRWVVFEPNDESLWKGIVRDVSAFLKVLWMDGALLGASPEEAFYVKCDEETNQPEMINSGIVVTEIGIAPVKPAEFVVFKIGQHESGTEKS